MGLQLLPDLVPLDAIPTRGEGWLRLPRESEADYARFRAYLESAYPNGYSAEFVPRSVDAIAEQIGMPPADLKRLSWSFQWAQRAGEWDREVDRRKRAADLDEVTQMRENHLRVTRKLRTLAEGEIDKLLAMSSRDPDIPVMTARDALAAADLAIKLERHLTTMPGPSLSGPTEQIDLEKLDLAELESMSGLLKKAAKGA